VHTVLVQVVTFLSNFITRFDTQFSNDINMFRFFVNKYSQAYRLLLLNDFYIYSVIVAIFSS